MRLLHASLLILLALPAIGAESAVSILEDQDSVTLSNGLVSARLAKATARLISLRYRDLDLISSGHGYMNCYGNSSDGIKTEKKPGTARTRLTMIRPTTAGPSARSR
jgi:hypothetical protein